MTDPIKFSTFKEFMGSLKTTKSLRRSEPREYLLHHYRDMQVEHSFMDDEGQIWDCVPVHQQPSLRNSSDRSFEKEPALEYTAPSSLSLSGNSGPLSQDRADAYGNRMHCPAGYIPLRRIRLEELTRYPDLRAFFRKKDQLDGIPKSFDAVAPGVANQVHKYVFTSGKMNHLGGDAFLSLWQPPVANDQFFSLSQIWVIGGEGNKSQTVEAGWHVAPFRYHTARPHLFTYWTADNYAHTGSYNLDQEGTFVQKSSHWALGGTLGPVSVHGGQQIDIHFTWRLVQNAWWLFLNAEPVGYYPLSLFRGGVLSHVATSICIGGEVSGQGSWPPMGSGAFAQGGFGNSAYIRNAGFFDTNNILTPLPLSPGVTAPGCYNFQPGTFPEWGQSFFYGGPGGNNC